MREINTLVVHCAATPNGDKRFTASVIDRMHGERGFKRNPLLVTTYQNETGNLFKYIGYHYVIHVDGAILHGRAIEEVGAHVQGHNSDSIGICLIGTDKFTGEQEKALRALLTDLRGRFPEANVCGHRDFSPDLNGDGTIEPNEWIKTCPGFDVATYLSNECHFEKETLLWTSQAQPA